MTTGKYLDFAYKSLAKQSIETARLDTLVLMEYVLGMDRAAILAKPNTLISYKQQNVLNSLLEKRSKHTPISYIVHSTEFYGRKFYINQHVLEPRPESETMIELFTNIIRTKMSSKCAFPVKVADVGTGSGALGITAKLECPNIDIELIDIDSKALTVAKKNVVIQTIEARIIKADLLPKEGIEYDILLCNLPYVPDDFHINLAASHEPEIAIYGGKDGLDIYRKLFKLVSGRQQIPLYILTESLPLSHSSLKAIANKSGYSLQLADDFIQVFKRNLG